MNTMFSYQYRDGANWKSGADVGNVVFAGTLGPIVPNNTVATELFLAHIDYSAEGFVAEQIKLPTCYIEEWDDDMKYAHGYHELLKIQTVDDEPTDGRTIGEFFAEFKQAHSEGWVPIRDLTPYKG